MNFTNLIILLIVLGIVAFYLTVTSRQRPQTQTQTHILTHSEMKQVAGRQRQEARDNRKHHKHLIQKAQTTGNELFRLHQLSDLYINGIPDKYDMFGRKLIGVAPSPDKAINVLTAAANMGSVTALFRLAKIYHYGLGELDPNIAIATSYYNRVLAGNNYTLRLLAQEKLDEIEQDNAQPIHRFTPFRPSFSNLLKGTSKLFDPLSKFLDPLGGQKVDITTIFRVPPNTNNQITINAAHAQVPAQTQDQTGAGGIVNDMHNVHDHSVIATIKQSYDKLSKDTNISIPKNKCCRELRNFVSGYLKNDKKKDALIALDAVERSFLPHTGIDATEAEVLALVR